MDDNAVKFTAKCPFWMLHIISHLHCLHCIWSPVFFFPLFATTKKVNLILFLDKKQFCLGFFTWNNLFCFSCRLQWWWCLTLPWYCSSFLPSSAWISIGERTGVLTFSAASTGVHTQRRSFISDETLIALPFFLLCFPPISSMIMNRVRTKLSLKMSSP